MSRETILEEINRERTYQQGKYGDLKDDTYMTPDQWVADITQYATRWRPGTYLPHSKIVVDDFRANMVKVAALAVAAIESLDRQRAGEDGEAFYECGPPPAPYRIQGDGPGPVGAAVNAANPDGSNVPAFEAHPVGDCPLCAIQEQERRYSDEGTEGPKMEDVVMNGVLPSTAPLGSLLPRE